MLLLRLRFARCHVVVCGLGRAGFKVATDCRRHGESVVIIEEESENEMVMTELSLAVEDDSTIYKLVGPVLAKQDLSEAKTSVKARLDYISKEIDRMDHLEKEFIGNVEDKKKIIMKLQNEFRAEAQRMQAAAQGGAPQ